MDSTHRLGLIEYVKSIGLPEDIEETPVVSLEQFFQGNDDIGSIGCNLDPHPGIARFFAVLKQLRDDPFVADVLVGIYEIDETTDDMWPYTEEVFVITSAGRREIEAKVKSLEVSEIYETSPENLRPEPSVPDNHRVYMLWWD